MSSSVLTKTEDQVYAIITAIHGGGRCQVQLLDEKKTSLIGVCRGAIKRRGFKPRTGHVVLASYRSFQDNKVDILHVYHPNEVKMLYKLKEIDKYTITSEDHVEEGGIVFEEESWDDL